jgi:HPt (histidine-containing phosphotransfer) domain-containing protein
MKIFSRKKPSQDTNRDNAGGFPDRKFSDFPISDPNMLRPLAEVLDETSLLEIVDKCLEDSLEKVNLISKAGETQNWDQACKYAHDIKSTAGQVGAHRLQDLAKQLEVTCKQDEGRDAPGLIAALKVAGVESQKAYQGESLAAIVAAAKS